LTCWVFHAGASGSSGTAAGIVKQVMELDIKSEMTGLISGMASCTSIEELHKVAGSFRTQGMITLVVKQLASVRWAVMHEGTKVLKSLGRSSCTSRDL
jgi:hypothetical protein